MKDSKKTQPLHAWFSHKQSKTYGFGQYLTIEGKTVYVTNVSIEKNIDNLIHMYDDLTYVGVVNYLEDVFPTFLKK